MQMTSLDQVARVRKLIAREPAVQGDKPALAGWLQRVCRTAATDLPAMGVGISILSEGSAPLPVAASSEALVLVEELQFELGEGPCIDAYASRRPVLIPDLGAAAPTWPGYVPAAHTHGVRAVFAFPLQVGAARLGAMDVYRDSQGGLSPDTLVRALTFAEVAMQRLLDAGTGTEAATDLFDDIDGNRFEVYQAQGMLMAQLDVSAEQALMRLRAYAYAHERRAVDVARDIIARKITLEPDA
jgi:GAF domain-containing protein